MDKTQAGPNAVEAGRGAARGHGTAPMAALPRACAEAGVRRAGLARGGLPYLRRSKLHRQWGIGGRLTDGRDLPMAFRGAVAGSVHRSLSPCATDPGARACRFAAPSSFPRPPSRRASLVVAALICTLAAGALAGCGLSEGVGSLIVDPARYSAYRCNDLVTEGKNLLAREKELRGLIDKAREGGGGTVIAALAYRSDYEAVLAREKLLKQTAAEKNCELVPTYNSDQTIR